MKKKIGIVIIIALVVIAVFCVLMFSTKKISRDEALDIAIKELNVSQKEILEKDVDFELGLLRSVYEVELETPEGEYFYRINAANGEILAAGYDID